jgi:hypothetical protein
MSSRSQEQSETRSAQMKPYSQQSLYYSSVFDIHPSGSERNNLNRSSDGQVKDYQLQGTYCTCETRSCSLHNIVSRGKPPVLQELPIEKWKNQSSYEEAWNPVIQRMSSDGLHDISTQSWNMKMETSPHGGARKDSTPKSSLSTRLSSSAERLYSEGEELSPPETGEALNYIGAWQNDNS